MKHLAPRSLWGIVAVSATVGLLASLIQTIERINYALQPKTALFCDINSVFSCTSVFDAWQSSVFGFSNSLVCMVFFGLTLGLSLAATTKSEINKNLRLMFQFMAIFFLAFGAWYLWQSTFVIGYICIFCLFCYAAVIAMNWAWFRINYHDLPLKNRTIIKIEKFVNAGGDIYVVLLWTVFISTMIITKFI